MKLHRIFGSPQGGQHEAEVRGNRRDTTMIYTAQPALPTSDGEGKATTSEPFAKPEAKRVVGAASVLSVGVSGLPL